MNKKLLIVDDDDKLRFNLTLFFEDEDFECIPFNNAENALKYINNNKCDFAIVDFRLPGITGEEFIIAASKISPCFQSVLYTGSADYRITPELAHTGMTSEDIFLKPLEDMNIMLDRIKYKLNI